MSVRRIRSADKSFPDSREGQRIDRLDIPLAEFSTPLLVLDGPALRGNLNVMASWAERRGLELMPHGKTTMAPALWRRQLDAGATGITVATGWQARTALRSGVPTVQIASECTDPRALRWLASWVIAHPGQDVVCWVDSLAGIERMEHALGGDAGIGVLVELGTPGGRTGARDPAVLVELAERVTRSPVLTLKGVAGYEGVIAHDRTPASLAAVRDYCDRLVDALGTVRALVDDAPWITAGGSAFFDVVAESFVGVENARAILRSGAYIVHDSGFYRGISPLDGSRVSPVANSLIPAIWGYARVVSRPEKGLALLDGGKRDFPFDEGLPRPVAIASDLGAPERSLHATITALNDQHAFLRWDDETTIEVGEVVRLGLSHPCTAFDKWRLIPVVDDSGMVIEAIETCF